MDSSWLLSSDKKVVSSVEPAGGQKTVSDCQLASGFVNLTVTLLYFLDLPADATERSEVMLSGVRSKLDDSLLSIIREYMPFE